MKKFFYVLAWGFVYLGILGACQDEKKTKQSHPRNELRVGVTAGPHAAIMNRVKEIAKQKGLIVKVIEFNDFLLPNKALDQGDLDLNCYQHEPFLEEQQKRNLRIKSVGRAILLPMGIYSLRYKNLGDIQEGGKISIPNDPTNSGRSLILLEKAGLITLKNTKNPTIFDIDKNPKKLQIIEIEAPQLPRTLQDVDAGVVNADWIIVSGMNPMSAILREDPKQSIYTNIIVAREGEENDEIILKFLKIYQSEEVKNFIMKEFMGAVLPGW